MHEVKHLSGGTRHAALFSGEQNPPSQPPSLFFFSRSHPLYFTQPFSSVVLLILYFLSTLCGDLLGAGFTSH